MLYSSEGVQTGYGETQTGADQPQSGDIKTSDAGEHPQRGAFLGFRQTASPSHEIFDIEHTQCLKSI